MLLAVLSLALGCSAACAESTSALGIGGRKCSAFNFAVERDAEAAIDAYVAWSQGFISGFNWSNVRELNVRIDAAGLLASIARYCAANPDSRVFAAAQEIVRLNAR